MKKIRKNSCLLQGLFILFVVMTNVVFAVSKDDARYYLSGENFTVSVYVNVDDITRQANAVWSIDSLLWVKVNGNREISLTQPYRRAKFSEGVALTSGIKHHIVVTYSNERAYAYVDGVEELILDLTEPILRDSVELKLGKISWKEDLQGEITHIETWNRSFNQGEVDSLYAVFNKEVFLREGVIAYYPLTDDPENLLSEEINNRENIRYGELQERKCAIFDSTSNIVDENLVWDNAISISAEIFLMKEQRNALVSSGHAFSLRQETDGCLQFTLPQVYDHRSSIFLESNKWHKIAMVYLQNNFVKLYHNGVLLDSVGVPQQAGNVQKLELGTNIWNDTFGGAIRNVIVWRRTVSNEEVSELHHLEDEELLKILPENTSKRYWIIIAVCIVMAFIPLWWKKEKLLKKSDNDWKERAVTIVSQNLSNIEFRIDDLAQQLHMSKTSLYNKIKDETGKTPGAFIRDIRLEKAADLLRKGELTVTEIIDEVGFESRAYFNKRFKEKYKTTPSAYKSGSVSGS
ncbi:helix-turn-helix domain-containing protein [Puteibacter caeruleilacunae]|nr:helix-turn-helix domain-containing protein [Puteibacter caeruleilacunae]